MMDAIELMRTAPRAAKAQMRKHVRRTLSECLKLMLKPQSPQNRAFLSGWLDYSRKALEALR